MFKKNETMPEGVKKAVSLEVFVFSGLFFGAFILLGAKMGAANMFNTLMNTAHNLLINKYFNIADSNIFYKKCHVSSQIFLNDFYFHECYNLNIPLRWKRHNQQLFEYLWVIFCVLIF